MTSAAPQTGTGRHARSDTSRPRTVVVVGASGGIGRATALLLAQRGDRLVLAARRRQALDAAADECREAGAAEVLVVPTDVADPQAVERLARRAEAAFGPIDAWVQSAGVMAYGQVVDVPDEVVRTTMATNVLGVVNAARAVLPGMRSRGQGTFLVVGSLLGRIAVPEMGAYVTSKWAVRGLMRTLELEQRDVPGVHVCEVWPGSVDTPIYDDAGTYTGRGGRAVPPVVSPERVATRIVGLLDRPRPRASVGPANRLIVLGFTTVPAVFDLLVGPLSRLLTQGGSATADAGNVLSPADDTGQVHGGWNFLGLRPSGWRRPSRRQDDERVIVLPDREQIEVGRS